MTRYDIHTNSTDLSVALDCEADRAQREGMSGVEKRQRATALHIRNAIDAMTRACPDGYRVQTTITFEHVLDVNAVLLDEYRRT